MKVRYKSSGILGFSSHFNTHALAEVLVNFQDGGADSAFIRDLEVELPTGWKDMHQAFEDKDILPDNHHYWFGVPDAEAKERGWL